MKSEGSEHGIICPKSNIIPEINKYHINLKTERKHTHTHTHTQKQSQQSKRIIFCICSNMWMDLEGIMITEISQKEKGKYCMISLICGI